jgi:acetyl esterase
MSEEAPLRFLERLESSAARLLMSLPPPVLRALSGTRPWPGGADELDPGIRLLLLLRKLRGALPVDRLPPDEARRRARRDAFVHAGPAVEVGSVRELMVPGAAGALPARVYSPGAPEGSRPLLVYFHGGGFVLGDLGTHDIACRILCRESAAHVLAVEYRLAPEFPIPCAIEDAESAFLWASANAAALGADPTRVAIGGDSAGGNLAAVVCRRLPRSGARPALQLLIYPAVDRSTEHPSLALFSDGYFLTRGEIEWYHSQYTRGTGVSRRDPRISPLAEPDHSELPPALVVTAAFDPLRDEGEAYAAALEAAGTPVRLWRAPGMVHGFLNMAGVSPGARVAAVKSAALLREMLG